MTTDKGIPMRAWTGRFRWPGKKEFRFGTVFVRHGGTAQEVEKELQEAFDKAWGAILPDATPKPDLIALEPGIIWFQREEEM